MFLVCIDPQVPRELAILAAYLDEDLEAALCEAGMEIDGLEAERLSTVPALGFWDNSPRLNGASRLLFWVTDDDLEVVFAELARPVAR